MQDYLEFLTHEQVVELTGTHTKARQIANLRQNGIRFTVKANGWPAVTVAAVLGTIPAKEVSAPAWRPRKAD